MAIARGLLKALSPSSEYCRGDNLKLPNEVKELRSKNHIAIISTISRSLTGVEVTSGGYLPSCEAATWISYTFTDVQVGYFFSLYQLENKKN